MRRYNKKLSIEIRIASYFYETENHKETENNVFEQSNHKTDDQSNYAGHFLWCARHARELEGESPEVAR